MQTDGDSVRSGLGDKVVDALVATVSSTRADLQLYREVLPDFAHGHSPRGLANWIHDRLWTHLVHGTFALSDVGVVEVGSTREVYVGTPYRLRLKRHDDAGQIASYPTDGALAFWSAADFMLPGLEEQRLGLGDVWDRDTQEMGDAVVSHRDGVDNVLWMVRLNDGVPGAAALATPIVPPVTPGLPRIEHPPVADGTTDA